MIFSGYCLKDTPRFRRSTPPNHGNCKVSSVWELHHSTRLYSVHYYIKTTSGTAQRWCWSRIRKWRENNKAILLFLHKLTSMNTTAPYSCLFLCMTYKLSGGFEEFRFDPKQKYTHGEPCVWYTDASVKPDKKNNTHTHTQRERVQYRLIQGPIISNTRFFKVCLRSQ